MAAFFYGLPIWLATSVILVTALIVGLGTSFGCRKLLGLRATDREAEAAALSLMQVVAAYIGILIAFAGVKVWQDFADAENAVHREAAAAAQLYRNLATYGEETRAARQDLRVYVTSIVRDEWPLLPKGDASNATDASLYKLFEGIGSVRPQDDRDATIYTEAYTDLNNLVSLRRDRLIHSESQMPLILWIVGLFGSILIVAYTATFPATRINTMMIAGISLALGLVFLFILVVDRPFMGRFSVSSSELSGLSEKFDQLDRLSAAERSTVSADSPKPEAQPLANRS